MGKRIVIVQGHPDPAKRHFCHALAAAYARAAERAGHEVRHIVVADIAFPLLRTKEDWESSTPPETIKPCQDDILWSQHLLIVYPLWLGGMPALLKGFLEQAFRPGLVTEKAGGPFAWKSLLKGRTARIVVTMGMPAIIYRWYFGAHSLKSLERNILRFCGIGTIRESLVGMVESRDDQRRGKWFGKMAAYGEAAR